jgi:outer membrane protein assembly factor BamB
VLVLLAAGVLVAWRVLAPAEVLATASDAYPAAAVRPPGVTGKTAGAPLIVEGRIRVFAAKRQVRADAPVDAKTSYTPRWSYRRWPSQLSGMVAVGPTVITRWSDGRLVALDGRTGRIVWRADGPMAGGYVGHRTGAETVWAPPGLHTSGTTVLVTDGERAAGYDATTGTRRWEAAAGTGRCFTAAGSFACGASAFDATTGAVVSSWPAGPWTPLGCGVASSGCAGLRDAAGHGWLASGGRLRRAPALDPLSTVPSGSVVLNVSGGLVVAERPGDGGELWRWAGGPVQVLGSSASAVYLLTSGRELVTLDLESGAVRSAFALAVGSEATTWTPGRWQVADGYVAVERLTGDGSPDPEAPNHYFTVETVILAATG